jgi:hypothetical protein
MYFALLRNVTATCKHENAKFAFCLELRCEFNEWTGESGIWISTGPVTARVGERLWKALYVEDA